MSKIEQAIHDALWRAGFSLRIAEEDARFALYQVTNGHPDKAYEAARGAASAVGEYESATAELRAAGVL